MTYVRTALAYEPREQFRALYLDRKNVFLRDESSQMPDADPHGFHSL